MKVNATPTAGQKAAGNYKKAHTDFDGLQITIENPKGSVRSGVNKAGKSWSTNLQDHYGYLRGVTGNDKDHLDIFLSPDKVPGAPVFIVDQRKPDDGSFDEHKVMLGYPSREEAINGYLRNYPDDWSGLGEIISMTIDQFKELISSGKLVMPVAMKKFSNEKIERLKRALRKGGSGSGRYPKGSGEAQGSDALYPKAGAIVDGREVLDDVPNMSSIGASINDPEILPGIREVKISSFEDSGKPYYYDRERKERTLALAEQIKESKQLKPLIVVEDDKGLYILEGGHRFDALKELGAKSFPAVVVRDLESLENKLQKGGSGSGRYPKGSGMSPRVQTYRAKRRATFVSKNGTAAKDFTKLSRQEKELMAANMSREDISADFEQLGIRVDAVQERLPLESYQEVWASTMDNVGRYPREIQINKLDVGTVKEKFTEEESREHQDWMQGNTWAHYSLKERAIYLNPDHFTNTSGFKNDLERCVRTNWHPTGADTIKSLVDHEYGHALQSTRQGQWNDAWKATKELFERTPRDEIVSQLSRYATESIAELGAESWCEYINNPNPRPFCQQVVKTFAEKL